jgi:ABC-2 type transport system ATP-binding protein
MEQRASDFWSAVADKYDRVVDLQIGPRTRSMVRERVLRERDLGRVVEVGCGTGFYTRALAEKAESVLATDLAPGMLDVAKRAIPRPNVTFQVASCEETRLPDASFDTAFVGLVLHFSEPARTLAEMARILKPGGTLLVVNLDPLALGAIDRIRAIVRITYQGIVGYRVKPPKRLGRNVLTERQLHDLLERAGLHVASSETIDDASRSSHIPLEYVRAIKEKRS